MDMYEMEEYYYIFMREVAKENIISVVNTYPVSEGEEIERRREEEKRE